MSASAQVHPVQTRSEEQSTKDHAIGVLTIPGEQPEIGLELLGLVARGLEWLELRSDATWGQLVGTIGSLQDDAINRAWTLTVGVDHGFSLREQEEAMSLHAQTVAFDLSLDCNAFRNASPQPFSRSVRGHALDALMIDNARRARLTGVFPDPDTPGELTLVLFTESRAQPPGMWRAQPLATVHHAPSRGNPASTPPLEIDLGEQWEGVLFALTDLTLGLDPASEAISTRERLTAWGGRRVGATRALASGFEGRVWIWAGSSSPQSIVVSLPLTRGKTAQDIAGALRTIFGQRLEWSRNSVGRATATLALARENRPAQSGDRTLSLRFITIAERTTLTIVTDATDLADVAEKLADIPQ